jgi:hypothetical protein
MPPFKLTVRQVAIRIAQVDLDDYILKGPGIRVQHHKEILVS